MCLAASKRREPGQKGPVLELPGAELTTEIGALSLAGFRPNDFPFDMCCVRIPLYSIGGEFCYSSIAWAAPSP